MADAQGLGPCFRKEVWVQVPPPAPTSATLAGVHVDQLPTPALVIERSAVEHNIATMSAALPGTLLRPHVKAHKCSALAAVQQAAGHPGFTCATPRELVGLARLGIGDDLLLANETLDPDRLAAMAAVQDLVQVTVAVDSVETIDAAASAGLRSVVIDVDIGLPRCGCLPDNAGRLADRARARGLEVRGVMGYEGHLMVVADPDEHRQRVIEAVDQLMAAHDLVGGEMISGGGTGTYHVHHADKRLSEVQAGSYALMDTHYAQLRHPFRQACFVAGTVVSVSGRRAVADVGLKAMGMDHGNPAIVDLAGDAALPDSSTVWFLSDEHITFAPKHPTRVGDRVRVVPAHIDPTMAMHEVAWLVDGDDVIDRWPIDLRHW